MGVAFLILELFGPEIGQHARSAVGLAELPFNLAVEKRGEEFWATWPEIRRTTVRTMK